MTAGRATARTYSFGQIADIAKSLAARGYPCAWPHDGRIEVSDENGDRPDGAAGVSKANLMREKGVNMLPSMRNTRSLASVKHAQSAGICQRRPLIQFTRRCWKADSRCLAT